jgi:hypothetical protein
MGRSFKCLKGYNMWVFMNDSFVSVVKHRTENILVVRSRKKKDLVALFKDEFKIIEMSYSDYQFRCFVPKYRFAELMSERINSIEYVNFKNSVEDKDRKAAYTGVWYKMLIWAETTLLGKRKYEKI